MDREKLIYDLSLMYVQEVVRHTDYKVVKDLAQYGGNLFYGSFKTACRKKRRQLVKKPTKGRFFDKLSF